MKIRKNIGTVIINAPASCGKSVILSKIKQMLKKEYGVNILIIEDRPMQEPLQNTFKDWEHEMVKDTVWVLTETTEL